MISYVKFVGDQLLQAMGYPGYFGVKSPVSTRRKI